MRIAVTGATGFLGRYIVQHLSDLQHQCRCWFRPTSRLDDMAVDASRLDWVTGELGDERACRALVEGCDAVVHAALHHPGGGFRRDQSAHGNIVDFAHKNVLGTLQLIEAAKAARVGRFIFISSCAVHDVILGDRKLDESHPLWSKSHYGAHKAAIEKFVHSYGLGEGFPICALRPTGIYGIASPVEHSRWFDLVSRVVRGEAVEVTGGGKEVHAGDVARAVAFLLVATDIAGQSYNCYDQYISDYDVATTAKSITNSDTVISGEAKQPLNQIETEKLRALGMTFGGWPLLEATIGEMVERIAGKSEVPAGAP